MDTRRAVSQGRHGTLLSSEGEDNNDALSLENQTNLNWNTGVTQVTKRRKIDGDELTIVPGENNVAIELEDEVLELPVPQIYERSHFFIDQLKDEYFEKQPDGWFKAKEEIDPEEVDPSSDLLDSALKRSEKKEKEKKQPKFSTRRWTSEEHQLFLEGLRLFGKDWDQVVKSIGTRDKKSVVSHGQKYLIRLIKHLDSDEPIEELSLEDAQYFFGILNKKNHWRVKQQDQKVVLKDKGNLFWIEKKKHKQKPRNPIDIKPEPAGSCYSKWKGEALGVQDAASFHQSLGYSIKLSVEAGVSGKCKLSFKSTFKYGVPLEADNDSATSQGDKHMRVFSVDEYFPSFREDPSLYKSFSDRMITEFKKLPDLRSPDEPKKIMIKFHTGRVCEVLFSVSLNDVLTYQSDRNAMSNSSKETHPNLQAYLDQMTKSKLDNDDFLAPEDEPDHSMWKYLRRVDAKEMTDLIEAGFTFFYAEEADVTMESS